jgi:hypothetical protein
MTPPRKRYRCMYCGLELPAWLPVFQEPDGALLLGHLSASHPKEVGAYLARIRTHDDVDRVAAEAYAVVDSPSLPSKGVDG